MAVTTNPKLSTFLLIISIVLFATQSEQSSVDNRSLLGIQRNRIQIPRCSDLASRSQCSKNPKCRWCQSESLDDMCFSKAEAWRLPSQVFVCDSLNLPNYYLNDNKFPATKFPTLLKKLDDYYNLYHISFFALLYASQIVPDFAALSSKSKFKLMYPVFDNYYHVFLSLWVVTEFDRDVSHFNRLFYYRRFGLGQIMYTYTVFFVIRSYGVWSMDNDERVSSSLWRLYS